MSEMPSFEDWLTRHGPGGTLNRQSLPADVAAFADEHESGQLRLAVTGEQMPLLPLPDALIPSTLGLLDAEGKQV